MKVPSAAVLILLAGCAIGSAACQQTSATQVVLPDTVNFTPPAGAHVVNDCVKLMAPDAPNPPKGVCIYFLDDPGADPSDRWAMPSMQAMEAYAKAMAASGWKFAHLAVVENYYERPRVGTDCSDLAVLVSLPREELTKLIAAEKAGEPQAGKQWRGYFIRDELREACGDSRKVRQS